MIRKALLIVILLLSYISYGQPYYKVDYKGNIYQTKPLYNHHLEAPDYILVPRTDCYVGPIYQLQFDYNWIIRRELDQIRLESIHDEIISNLVMNRYNGL